MRDAIGWARVLAARWRGLFRHKRREQELDEEVRFHLAMQIEHNLGRGMNAAEARNSALRSFGGVEPMKEAYRERSSFTLIETTVQDLRYAARILRKNPGFTATSIAVLALAMGANTAMFSVLNAVLLRPLPYRSPEQLAMLWSEVPSQNLREGRSAYWNIEQWRSQSGMFADMALFDGGSATLTSADRTEQISIVRHSANLFPLLGIRPLQGRIFSAAEAEQRLPLVLISHRFWQTRFGGAPEAIGATLAIDGVPSQIIGILPADFQFLQAPADVWQPHTLFRNWEEVRRARGSGFWSVVGRLRPDVSIEQAQAEMNAIARRLDADLAGTEQGLGISVVPLSVQVTGHRARLALWMLAGSIFTVLLIATTNVASLSLARSASRAREMAVRTALGASRARIVRQLLAESLTLAVASGVLGLLIAVAGLRFILAVKPANLARLEEVSLDLRLIGWALTLCVLTGVLVGLAPAITAARRSFSPAGREGGRGLAGGVASRRIRRGLVVAQFAMAIVLLVSAGLLVRSLWSAQNVDLGFRAERVLSMQLSTTAFQSPVQRASFYRGVLEQIEALPGVESAGVISDLFVGGNPERLVTAEGATQSALRFRFRSDEVSTGFFRAIGTPLLRGRFFSAADGPDSPPAVIVNDAMARCLWRGMKPVGRRFKAGTADAAGPWFTVVGVVGDMRRQGLESEPIPQMFEPLAQNPSRLATLLVRTSAGDPLRLAGTVQSAVRRVDKHVPIYGVTTLGDRLDGFLSERRFQTSLLVGFSVVALLMAAIGIFGLIQYSISTRTHEIGIRVAVGAPAAAIFRMIMREGLLLSLTGLSLGLAGSLWLGRVGASLLFGVTATDPLTFLSVSVLLTAVAAAACYFPARRAMKVEPTVALRQG